MALGSLFDSLVQNAKFVQADNPDVNSTNNANGHEVDLLKNKGGEPSACELQCKKEQAAIVSCMNFIQDQREASHESESGSSSIDNKCLSPAVMAWTTCCSTANNNNDG